MQIVQDPQGRDLITVTAQEFDAEFAVSGSAPVQAFGTVLGRELYFRSRHDAWSFDVADRNGLLPSDGSRQADGFYRQGTVENASYLPLREVLKIIVRCLREYTGAQA